MTTVKIELNFAVRASIVYPNIYVSGLAGNQFVGSTVTYSSNKRGYMKLLFASINVDSNFQVSVDFV